MQTEGRTSRSWWCRVAVVTTVSITAATEVSAQGTSCQRHCGGGVVSVRGTLGTRGHRLQRAVWQESVPHLPTSLPHSAVSGPPGSGSCRSSVGLTGVQACERGQGHHRNAPCQFWVVSPSQDSGWSAVPPSRRRFSGPPEGINRPGAAAASAAWGLGGAPLPRGPPGPLTSRGPPKVPRPFKLS